MFSHFVLLLIEFYWCSPALTLKTVLANDIVLKELTSSYIFFDVGYGRPTLSINLLVWRFILIKLRPISVSSLSSCVVIVPLQLNVAAKLSSL